MWGLVESSVFVGGGGVVMQLDKLVVVESVLCNCQLVGFEPNVPMVFFDPSVCVDQLICPVTGHAAHTQVVPHSTKVAGDLPGW
jgi:hypothetical protein